MWALWYLLIAVASLFVAVGITSSILWLVEIYRGYDVETARVILLLILACLAIILLSMGIVCGTEYSQMKTQLNQFTIMKEQVKLVIDSGTEMSTAGVANVVIEQNVWLAKAQAHLQHWGQWSVYYGTGIDTMTPILCN